MASDRAASNSERRTPDDTRGPYPDSERVWGEYPMATTVSLRTVGLEAERRPHEEEIMPNPVIEWTVPGVRPTNGLASMTAGGS